MLVGICIGETVRMEWKIWCVENLCVSADSQGIFSDMASDLIDEALWPAFCSHLQFIFAAMGNLFGYVFQLRLLLVNVFGLESGKQTNR